LILGRHLALNPLVIFLSVLFWFWIWGIMGALMAVPILVFLKTAGEHLSFFTPLSRVAGR
jgi:predicted PurR-regulated permease PerM